MGVERGRNDGYAVEVEIGGVDGAAVGRKAVEETTASPWEWKTLKSPREGRQWRRRRRHRGSGKR